MNIRVHVKSVVCLICGLALLGSLVHAQKSEAGTYYVAPNGNDSNPGDTENQPFQTIDTGAQALMPGDTLYVMNGTYTGTLAFYGTPSGTSNSPVTIAAYPGHRPVIQPTPGDYIFYISYTSYMVIDGFFFDGAKGSAAGIKITDGSSHITIRNSEVAYTADGIEVNDGAEGNEFMNLQIHDNTYYGVYIASSNNVVEGCSIHSNGGYGIHAYSGSGTVNNNIIGNNEIYGNGNSGIILSHGDGNQVYDNIIWGNVGGIWVDYGASNSHISGNTIYGNSWAGIYIGPGGSNTFIGDNNISDNYGPVIINNGVSTQILP